MRHDLLNALIEIHTLMNAYERVAESALRLYSETPDLTRRIYYLGFAAVSLTRAIAQRRHPQLCSPPYRPTSRTIDDLEQQSSVVALQQRLNELCYLRDIKFTSDLDFVTNPAANGRAAAFFLIHGEDIACADVCRIGRLSTDRVLDAAITLFDRLTPEDLATFVIKYVRSHGNPTTRAKAICRLMAGLALSPQWPLIVLIVSELKLDSRQQCLLLCEFDWLFEALNLALITGLADVVPVIAYRACMLGLENVWKECERLLDAVGTK